MTPLLSRLLLPISIALLLASCTQIIDNRGHNDEDADMTQIVVGQTKDDDVKALLGSPTTQSSYGDQTWYYVTQKQEHSGVFPAQVQDQHVTAISFDKDHVVSDISEYKKEDGKPVEMVSKTTPTEGHNLTFMEQMLGNLGRFNAPGHSALSDRNLGH
jgi:outer membrane protein assembly factor BamE (lipoprotein component of BamABCDE complex)